MSFLTGFATGLAKSVDTQLKESIERTRDNIDMVSKWRLKKAEEREKERRAKDKEIEQLIKDAAYVIGGDQNDVNSQNIAAALYKQRGLSGFTDDIAVMKEARAKGQSPIDFINRASVDVPANKFGLSEIVRSLSDAESSFAPSDMIFPKGTIKGSGLISALVPDFDATAAGAAQAKDQMKQIGFTTTPTATSLSFDRYTFDRESLGYATKSVNEKLSYLRNIIDDPSADPDLATKANERLNELLNKSMTGEEGSAIQAINIKLARFATQDTSAMSEMQFKAFDAEQSALIERRETLQDTINLRDAKTQKERLAIQADIAFRKGDEEEGFRLQYAAEDLGGMTTYNTLIQRVNSRILRNNDDEDYKNSTGDFKGKGLKEDQASIQAFKFLEQESNGVPFEKIEAFAGYIRRAALNEFKAAHPSMYKDLVVNAGEDGKTIDADAFVAAVTGAGADATRKYNDILATVAQRYKTIGAKHGVSENTFDSAITLVTGTGLPDVSGDAKDVTDAIVGAKPTTAQTQALLEATTPEEMQIQQEIAAGIRIDPEQVSSLESDFSNTSDGAANLVKSVLSEGDSSQDVKNIAGQMHGPEFSNLVNAEISKIETTVDAAVTEKATSTIGTLAGVGPDQVSINPNQKTILANNLAEELSISSETASNLIDQSIDKMNQPLPEMKPEDANVENVLKVLEQEDLLLSGGIITKGGVAPARRDQAVQKIREVFNLNTTDAMEILDEAITDYRSKVRPFIEVGEIDFSLRNILTDAVKDIPANVTTETIKETKLNPVQLAMRFADGTITEEETIALKKAVQGEGGAELANAIKMIRDRRTAEKQVSAYKSRGGLMSR